MKKKEAKELVRKIFGVDTANDNDIVDFYLQVNKVAMQEYAEAYHKEQMKKEITLTENEIKE